MIARLLLLFVLSTSLAHAASDGATLYARHCAACHGDQGRGGIGVPLALPSFQTNISDDYVRQTIRRGRPGRVMPAFRSLSDEDVNAIVQFVRQWNPGPARQFAATPVQGDTLRGAQLFAQNCAQCHGAHGEGGQGTGVTFSRPRALPIMAPAIGNPGFLAAATDAQILSTIQRGREGTPMPAFGHLPASDLAAITAFVRQLGAKAAPVADASQEPPVLSVDSPYDLATTVANLKAAATAQNFIFIREQTLDDGLAAPGQEDHTQHLVYICSFSVLNEALAADPRVGLFLPCRITVLAQGGKVKMITVNPKRLSLVFNNRELEALCTMMRARYLSIMEEAAL